MPLYQLKSVDYDLQSELVKEMQTEIENMKKALAFNIQKLQSGVDFK